MCFEKVKKTRSYEESILKDVLKASDLVIEHIARKSFRVSAGIIRVAKVLQGNGSYSNLKLLLSELTNVDISIRI